ncbi:MAG: VWA domain-containing protein [Candidatus Lokiarchaeota archaeon]|nr:VWA domain-containing protein [Candidatus Lokiarchaeota archaeon]
MSDEGEVPLGLSPPDESKQLENKIMRGEVSKKDLLKMRMQLQGKAPGYYEKIAQQLDYKEIEDLAVAAVKQKNLNALRGLAELNRAAVAAPLQEAIGYELVQEAAEKGSGFAPEFFFLLRSVLTPYYKRLYKNLTKLVILKESRKIAGRGLKGWHKLRTRYIPYRTDLDIPRTVQNLAGRPITYMTGADLAGIERVQKQKAGVLILDTSGSMYGRLIFNAALTTAVLSYHMRDNEYAVVLFNTSSQVMKKINERRDNNKLIDEILETAASGFTNITAGLNDGLEQMRLARSHYRFAILITDGNANRAVGEIDEAASRFENLHVIAIPTELEQAKAGLKNCERIARLGKGMFVRVGRFKDIPHALQRLLLRI